MSTSIVLFLEQLYTQTPKITTPSLGMNTIRNPGHPLSREKEIQSLRTYRTFMQNIVKKDPENIGKPSLNMVY